MAPWRSVLVWSGITRSASIFFSTPRPEHAGHAPCGELNENSRGSISEIVKPETGQANLEEKIRRLASCSWPNFIDGPSWPAFLPSSSWPGERREAPSLRVESRPSTPSWWDLRRGSPGLAPPVRSPSARGAARPGDDESESANSTTAMPSASFSAVSKLSASRCLMSARTTSRSTTTSRSCLSFLSSDGASEIS